MTEQENSPEELEAFREEFKHAVESTLFVIVTGQDDGPFQIDPFSLGLGEQTLAEVGPSKQQIIKEELYKALRMEKDETEQVAEYKASDDENLSVSVFRSYYLTEEETRSINEAYKHFWGYEPTRDVEERHEVYLHEIKHEGGEIDWQLSNSSDPLL